MQLVAKIRLEEEKHNDATRKIRECPHLSRQELEKFNDVKRKALLKALEKCNKNLQKFSHINKKALGQFEDFNAQKEELEARKKELDTGAESIQVRCAIVVVFFFHNALSLHYYRHLFLTA